MRIIEAGLGAVRSVGVAPDGRFVAAAAGDAFSVFGWASGAALLRARDTGPCEQAAFYPPRGWLARAVPGNALRLDSLDPAAEPPLDLPGAFAGGLAVSPDGKVLVAARAGDANQVALARWSLPGFQPLTGFDFWSPFRRLAFSPNGEFLAGIRASDWGARYSSVFAEFELRFAHSGGLDYRLQRYFHRDPGAPGFVSFTRDSSLCAFGWPGEFHVLDISTGTYRYTRGVEASFRDAAFTGSGRHLATADEGGRLRLWDARTWQVAREYDWGCGPLTCLAFTADGTAGVCGTADGRLVQFDVDE